VEATHNGYEGQFGVRHQRHLALSARGLLLTGQDSLLPAQARKPKAESLPFAIRFHIHPDVRVSPSQGGDVLLKLPDGAGWRFRASGGPVSVEESVYLGDDVVRRTEQLVVSGAVKDAPVTIGWSFEQINSSPDPQSSSFEEASSERTA
jgi:uncharacterized heparinase superfamily protein